jgi:hypothetical protein
MKTYLLAAVAALALCGGAANAQTREDDDRVDVYHSCLSMVDEYWYQHHNDPVRPTQAEMNERAEKCNVYLRR